MLVSVFFLCVCAASRNAAGRNTQGQSLSLELAQVSQRLTDVALASPSVSAQGPHLLSHQLAVCCQCFRQRRGESSAPGQWPDQRGRAADGEVSARTRTHVWKGASGEPSR